MIAPRIEDAIAGGYKLVSRTVVALIQWKIKARTCAVKLVVLVKLSGQQKLKNFFPKTVVVRSFFLADLKSNRF